MSSTFSGLAMLRVSAVQYGEREYQEDLYDFIDGLDRRDGGIRTLIDEIPQDELECCIQDAHEIELGAAVIAEKQNDCAKKPQAREDE